MIMALCFRFVVFGIERLFAKRMRKSFDVAIIGTENVNMFSILNRFLAGDHDIEPERLNAPIALDNPVHMTFWYGLTKITVSFSIIKTDGNLGDDFHDRIERFDAFILAFNIDNIQDMLPLVRIRSLIHTMCIFAGIDSPNGWATGWDKRMKTLANGHSDTIDFSRMGMATYLIDPKNGNNIQEMFSHVADNLYSYSHQEWRMQFGG